MCILLILSLFLYYFFFLGDFLNTTQMNLVLYLNFIYMLQIQLNILPFISALFAVLQQVFILCDSVHIHANLN